MKDLSELIDTMRDTPADRVVDALRAIHLRTLPDPPRAGRKDADRTAGSTEVDRRDWDDAQRFFSDLESKMHARRGTADAVIERLRDRDQWARARNGGLPSQQLLRVEALVGSRAGGRFVVHNPHTQASLVEFVVGRMQGGVGEGVHLPVLLTPDKLLLEPGQRAVARCSVDLAPLAQATDRIELFVDGFVGRERVMRIWVEIDVVDPCDLDAEPIA